MVNYINISNSLVEIENENRLNIDELYVFSYLWTERTYENRVKTTIEILNDDVELLKTKKDNKKRIEQNLKSLEDKGLINIEDKDRMLIINFAPHKVEGYTGVSYEKIRQLNPNDFYIYVLVAKWKDGASYSYENWAVILNCSERTAKRMIKKAVEDKVIYKLEGTYNGWVSKGQKKQDVNTYSIKPFLISERQEQIKKEVKKTETQNFISLNEIEFVEFRTGNWFDKENFPNDKDYDEYFLRKKQAEKGDEVAQRFIKHCENRIESLINNNNDEIKRIAKDKLEKAEQRFNKEKTENANKIINTNVKNILDETGDIALIVNGKLIPFKQYDDKDKVEKVFYFEKIDISDEVGESGAYVTEVKTVINPKFVKDYRLKHNKFNWEVA